VDNPCLAWYRQNPAAYLTIPQWLKTVLLFLFMTRAQGSKYHARSIRSTGLITDWIPTPSASPPLALNFKTTRGLHYTIKIHNSYYIIYYNIPHFYIDFHLHTLLHTYLGCPLYQLELTRFPYWLRPTTCLYYYMHEVLDSLAIQLKPQGGCHLQKYIRSWIL
jgi:hypothetical protein